jgi:ribonuclease BN (tRNA processing enzyme)
MMTVKFHGVRGSHPVACEQMSRYGGNTLCVEVTKTNRNGEAMPLLFDLGTGVIKRGYTLAREAAAGNRPPVAVILMTHLHPDHLDGYPFFRPVFNPLWRLTILGMEPVAEGRLLPPNFPLTDDDLAAQRVYRQLNGGECFYITQDGAVTNANTDALLAVNVMRAFAPSHPRNGALYYRVTDPDTKRSVVTAWDIESHWQGDQRLAAFADGTDIIIHDATYTNDEYNSRNAPVQGFGHSSYEMALADARLAGARCLVAIHYNPTHTDAFLDQQAATLSALATPKTILAREGMALTIEDNGNIMEESFPSSFAE